MHYWNRDNFEGLAALATELRRDARLEDLASYCELRERGLRGEAFAALERFLASASTVDVSIQRTLVLHIMSAHWRTTQAHQFLSHPLQHRFLEPVLTAWAESAPLDPTPVSELGLLHRDQQLLARALDLNPANDRVRASLVELLLGYVEHATHHLVEGKLIGNVEHALSALDEAEQHARAARDPARLRHLLNEADEYRHLLSDWAEYQRNPTGSFPEWCRTRNRQYSWRSIVYYNE